MCIVSIRCCAERDSVFCPCICFVTDDGFSILGLCTTASDAAALAVGIDAADVAFIIATSAARAFAPGSSVVSSGAVVTVTLVADADAGAGSVALLLQQA